MQGLKLFKPALFLITMLFYRGIAVAQQEVYICPGDTLHIKAEAQYADSYVWYKDSRQIDNRNSSLLDVSEPGVYTVVALNKNSCSSSMSWPFVVKQRILEAKGDVANTAINTPIAIKALSNDITGCWELDNGTISILTAPVKGNLELQADGTIVYHPLSNQYGADSFVYTVQDMAGLTSNAATVNVVIGGECAVVYPNPARDFIQVELLNKDIAYLRLADGSGQILEKAQAIGKVQTVNISNYAAGLYILQLLNASGDVECIYKVVKRSF